MSAARGLVFGMLGLTMLDAAVSNAASAKRVGALGGFVTEGFRRLVDPTVPLIPDRTAADTPPPTTTHH